MTTIDSLKIKIIPDNLDYDKLHYTHKENLEDGVSIFDKMVLDKNIIKNVYGLNKVEIDERENSIILEMSAKILGKDYMKGISNNTLENVINNINDMAKLNLSIYDILSADILRADLTKNIIVEDVRDAIRVLKLGKNNSGFLVTEYEKKNNCGLVYQGKQTSYKNRQIYYDKYTELTKVSRNRDFVNKYGDKEFINSITNVLRIEQNVTEKRTMKNIFKIDSTRLGNILDSNINPVLERHKIITKYSYGVELFDTYNNNDYKLKDVIMEIGFIGILEKCNNNLDVAVDFLKSFIGENRKYHSTVNRFIKKLREIHVTKLIEKDKECITYINKLNEIMELLKAS